MSNVSKLGKGPEHGHVNCFIFFNKFARGVYPQVIHMIKITL